MTLLPGKLPVLIIEDNPETAFIYSNYLQKTEFQPIVVSSVEQARRTLATCPPVGHHPGHLSGGPEFFGVYSRAANCAGTESVPIIVISVMDEARKVLSYGADKFLRKPVDQETFLRDALRAGRPAGT